MLDDKKIKTLLIIEFILPWTVLLTGIPAIIFYDHNNSAMLDIFFSISLIITVIATAAESIFSLIGLISIIMRLCDNSKPSVMTSAILWICGGLFSFGTVLLMFIVNIFTYAQSI